MEIVGNSGATVAAIPRGYPARRAEREANARLIAQAPAMLTMLRAVTDCLQLALESGLHAPIAVIDSFSAVNKHARAVLRAVEED